MNNCTICNTELINKERVLRARLRDDNGKPAGGLYIDEAWCPTCEIYLRQKTRRKEVSGWIASPIKHDELAHEVSEEEFSRIKSIIKEKSTEDEVFSTKERWDKFISMKKENDKLYHYIQNYSSHKIEGYVIKRDIHLIGYFVFELEYHNTDKGKN